MNVKAAKRNAVRCAQDVRKFDSELNVRDSFYEWLNEEPTAEWFAKMVCEELGLPWELHFEDRLASDDEMREFQNEQYSN